MTITIFRSFVNTTLQAVLQLEDQVTRVHQIEQDLQQRYHTRKALVTPFHGSPCPQGRLCPTTQQQVMSQLGSPRPQGAPLPNHNTEVMPQEHLLLVRLTAVVPSDRCPWTGPVNICSTSPGAPFFSLPLPLCMTLMPRLCLSATRTTQSC